jgi:hypothetical protein
LHEAFRSYDFVKLFLCSQNKITPKFFDMPIDVSLTTEQTDHLKISPKTASGKDGKLKDPAVWAVDSGDATIAPDADGLGATVTPGTEGASVISVKSGSLSDTANITVTAADVTDLGLSSDGPK